MLQLGERPSAEEAIFGIHEKLGTQSPCQVMERILDRIIQDHLQQTIMTSPLVF